MRQFRETQLSLTPTWGLHQHTRELQMAAKVLDLHPELCERVHQDLIVFRRMFVRTLLSGGRFTAAAGVMF